jgi:outer membrane receptor protein involved in Fe transport
MRNAVDDHTRLIISLAIAVSAPLPALAQTPSTSAPESPTAGSSVIGEIVVTATRRETSLEKTPISISAVTGAELERQGIASIEGLVQQTPGIFMATSGPGQSQFEIRGVSGSGGSSPTVGFYLDDVPINPPAAANNGKVIIDPNLYDLSRVEILRGPQGTVFGSGSMGGTIRLITNPADPSGFKASAETSLSGTDGGGFNHAESVMVNLPIVNDVLALRVVGTQAYTSGWINRVVLNPFPLEVDDGNTRGALQTAPVSSIHRDDNNEELTGVRASLTFKPNENLTISPSVFYQRIHQDDPNTFDSNPGTLAHYQPFDVAEPFSDEFLLGNITAIYRLPYLTITSITAGSTRTEKNTQDASENFQWALGFPNYSASAGGIGAATVFEDDITKQFSQEVRIASSGSGRLQWLVGGFYSAFKSNSNVFSTIPGILQYYGTTNFAAVVQPTFIHQVAGFGEVTYALTDRLKATAGVRYYSYTTKVSTDAGGVAETGSDASKSYVARESDSGLNPKFSLDYQVSDQLLVYTTAAKGFRPGGGNQPIPTDPSIALGSSCLAALEAFGKTSAPAGYQPDSVWSYEVGAKSHTGWLTVNGSAYYEDWRGIQQTVALSCGFPYTDNLGRADIYGAELEMRAALPSNIVISEALGYTSATLATNSPETGSHKGDRIQSVPPWTSSTSVEYTRAISNRWEFTSQLTYNYVDTRVDATFSPMNHLPAYSLVNIRAGVENNVWGVTLFVDNLFDKKAWITDTPTLSVNTPMFNRVATNQPLTAGIRATYKY